MGHKNIIISEGNRPFWQLAIASVFYTLALICFYLFVTKVDLYEPIKKVRSVSSLLEVSIMLFFGGLGFSGIKFVYFDFENKNYKSVFCVGPIKFGKWKKFKTLDYIGVFKNSKGQYEVNIWFDRNKHLNIVLLFEENAALKEGEKIAIQLNLDLYDATNPKDRKWIKLNK